MLSCALFGVCLKILESLALYFRFESKDALEVWNQKIVKTLCYHKQHCLEIIEKKQILLENTNKCEVCNDDMSLHFDDNHWTFFPNISTKHIHIYLLVEQWQHI